MLRRKRALLHKETNDDEFETPAFRDMTNSDTRGENSDDGDDVDDHELDQVDEDDTDKELSDEESDIDLERKDNEDDDDDSDEAPEDVGFSDSRKAALSQMRDVINQMKEDKMKLKSKRKLKDDKFKEQKRLKLEALTRLPEEVINSLSEKLSEPEQKDKIEEIKKKDRKKKKKDTDTTISQKDPHITIFEENEDFIPLEAGIVDSESGVKVVALKAMRKKMSVSQSAANFKNARLYGDLRKRETTKAFLAKKEKRRICRKKLRSIT